MHGREKRLAYSETRINYATFIAGFNCLITYIIIVLNAVILRENSAKSLFFKSGRQFDPVTQR